MSMLDSFHFNNHAFNVRTGLFLILIFVGSIAGLPTTTKTATIRDLHFDMPYFEEQVNTWTGISLAFPAPPSMMSTDCGKPLLGGPGVFSWVAGRFEKNYSISIPYISVFITFDLTMIDTWASSDGVVAIINDTSVGWFPWGSYPSLWPNNICGANTENDLGSTKAWIAATASKTELSVALSRYAQFTNDGNFGIRNMSIILSNKTVSSIPAFNGNTEGFCLFLPSGMLADQFRCKCGLSEYNDTSSGWGTCRSCHSSCETCYGGLETECLNCVPGYTYDGSVCIKCDSSCDTCFGTDADQCATCPAGSYLYPDSTCRSTCEAYFIRTSGAYSYCDLYRCTELNTLNYQEVKNGTLYYYPDEAICKTTCPSPYIMNTGWNVTICELPLSKLDKREVAYLVSTGATTGSVMTAGVTAMTALDPCNPSALSVATLSKIFEYTRQFDVIRSPRLELYYKSHKASPGTVKIGSELPEEAVAQITYHPLPSIFVKNSLHSSFLVNFFVGFQTLLIISAATLLLFGIQSFVRRKYVRFVDLCEKIILAVVSFLTTQFYGIYADILFLGTLQYMAFSGGTALTWFGFFLAIFFYLLALSLLAFHAKLLWTYQKIKAKADTEEGDNEMKEFQIKYKKAEVLYRDFKDLSLIHQSFLLFLTARAAITGIVMSSLNGYPGVQIVFNILMNILTIIYLAFKSPYKSSPTVFQQIVYELDFVLVNICFLIMAALDVNGGDTDNLRALLGDVIINAIVASQFIPIITIVPKVIEVIQEAIKVIKNRNKVKENYEVPTESPLSISARRRETTYPDENQPIIKDSIKLELVEKQHKEEEFSLTSSGNQTAKKEEVKINLISKTCLGREGNEFDNEAMSPIMPVYIRETFIHRDEETPKTSSGNQTYEMTIKPIRLENVRTEMISKTCLGREEGNEFDNEERSPVMQASVRDSLMK